MIDQSGQTKGRYHQLASPGRVAAACSLALLLLAACSSDGTGATSTTTESATTIEPLSTTTAPTTSPTTSPPTSAAVETSTASTASPTVATTTLPVSTDPVEAAVSTAYRSAFDSWTECLRTLPNCDLVGLAEFRTGAYLDGAVIQADRWNGAGQTVENLESRDTTIEAVEILSPGQANVIACEVDGTVRSDSAGNIIDDSFASVRSLFVLVDEGGVWKITGSEGIEVGQDQNGNVCT